MAAELGGTLVPLGERVSAIEAKLVYIEQLIVRAESVGKERDEVARREHETFKAFVADAQRVLADALKEYKSGSNEWRDTLNDALTKGVQQPEFRGALDTVYTKIQGVADRIQANMDRISKLENKDAEDKALGAQAKEKEKDQLAQERDMQGRRTRNLGFLVTGITVMINVLFQLWRTRKP